jgi:hypothetical protein
MGHVSRGRARGDDHDLVTSPHLAPSDLPIVTCPHSGTSNKEARERRKAMEVAQAEAEKLLRDEHNMTLLDTLDEKRRTRQAEQVINMHTCTLRAQSTDGLWREAPAMLLT